MTILFIDTSKPLLLIGLIQKGRVILAQKIETPQLSLQLFPAIETALQAAGLSKAALDAIAVGVGPGSFNGTRSGVVAGMSLAFGLGVPCLSFPSLIAYVPECCGSFTHSVRNKAKAYAIRGSITETALQVTFQGFIPIEEILDVTSSEPTTYTALCLHLIEQFKQGSFKETPEVIYFGI